MARAAAAGAASTCTTPTRPRRTSRSPARSRRGQECRPAPTCCSTKACTARCVTDKVNVARHADLLVGVVPIINLEWIQKLHRDKAHARLLHRGGGRHHPAPHARLRELHLPAVLAHAHEFPARADGRHLAIRSSRATSRRADESFLVIRFANPQGHRLPVPAVHDARLVHVAAEHSSSCRAARWNSRCS